jgi:hypothetical protein
MGFKMNLQLFGGRGGGSGMGGGGGFDAEGFAQDLFGSKKKSGIDDIYGFLRSDLLQEKETGEWDQDMSYWVIDKYGTEYFFGPDGDNAATRKEFKKSDISYISVQGPEGRDDSMGLHTYSGGGHTKIGENADYESRYDDEVNRLFGTRWGKKHPR